MKSPRNCQARGGGAPNRQEITYSASGRREEEKKLNAGWKNGQRDLYPGDRTCLVNGPDLSGGTSD
jgi:hypothetical protein